MSHLRLFVLGRDLQFPALTVGGLLHLSAFQASTASVMDLRENVDRKFIADDSDQCWRRRLTCNCANERARDSIDGSHFFVRNLFPEPGFGALTRFFYLGFVDFVRRNSHIGKDGHACRP